MKLMFVKDNRLLIKNIKGAVGKFFWIHNFQQKKSQQELPSTVSIADRMKAEHLQRTSPKMSSKSINSFTKTKKNVIFQVLNNFDQLEFDK